MSKFWDEFKHLRWPKGTGQGGQFKGGDGGDDAWAHRISNSAGARHGYGDENGPEDVDPHLGKRDLLAELDSDEGVSGNVNLAHFNIPARRRALESDEGLSSRDDTIEHWAQTLRDEQVPVLGSHGKQKPPMGSPAWTNGPMHEGGNTEGGTPSPAGDQWAQGISDRYDAAHSLSEALGARYADTSDLPPLHPWLGGPPDTTGMHQRAWERLVRSELSNLGVDPDEVEADSEGFGRDYFEYQSDPVGFARLVHRNYLGDDQD